MPDVAELPRPAQGPPGAAADPDLRLLRRQRLGRRIVERPVLALEVVLTVPERAHQPDRLVRAAATARELDAHEVVLVLVPAHADAERETAAAQLLERRNLLGE